MKRKHKTRFNKVDLEKYFLALLLNNKDLLAMYRPSL
ncbi:unnamed protein product, partial [marine sediment metagenome]